MRRRGGGLRRFAAAALAVLIIFQCLPLTVGAPAGIAEETGFEAKIFFESIQVCDHGDGLTAFLADHPWLPGAAFLFFAGSGMCLLPALTGGGLPAGFPPAVYKPPRAALS